MQTKKSLIKTKTILIILNWNGILFLGSEVSHNPKFLSQQFCWKSKKVVFPLFVVQEKVAGKCPKEAFCRLALVKFSFAHKFASQLLLFHGDVAICLQLFSLRLFSHFRVVYCLVESERNHLQNVFRDSHSMHFCHSGTFNFIGPISLR